MKLGGLLGKSEATLLGDTESSDSPHFGSDSGRQEPEQPSRASNADSTRTEVEDASPSTRPPKGVQRFQEGATVLCMRSTGAESPAMILSYDPISETYEVELDAVGSGLRKRCKEDSLRKAKADLPGAAAPPDFAIGACVFVKRSSGEESIAFVQSYANGVYVLELESKGSGKKKNAPSSMIRSSPSEAPPPPPPRPRRRPRSYRERSPNPESFPDGHFHRRHRDSGPHKVSCRVCTSVLARGTPNRNVYTTPS